MATLVTVFIHEFDTEMHPTVPPGWRWAVHIGSGVPGDVTYCANAGWVPSEKEAMAEGEQAASTASATAKILGTETTLRVIRLDHDPILPGADRVTVI